MVLPSHCSTTVSAEALRSETPCAGYWSAIQKKRRPEWCSTPDWTRKSRYSAARSGGTLPKDSPSENGSSKAAQRMCCSRISRLSGLIRARSGEAPKRNSGWWARNWSRGSAEAMRTASAAARPAPGPARLLPGRRDGARVAGQQRSAHAADVDAQLQGIGRHHRAHLAGTQAALDLPPLAGQVAAAVAAGGAGSAVAVAPSRPACR